MEKQTDFPALPILFACMGFGIKKVLHALRRKP